MTAVENLLFDHPTRFQAQMVRVEEKVEEVAGDIRGVRQHMAAFLTSEFNQDASIAAIRTRLDRIERRLDLID
jgi:hypothetical protein